MTALRLLTLGSAELRRIHADGSQQALAVNGKPFALLCRLAFSNTRTLSRDVLAEDLWSELEPARARAQLRTALWSLRRHVGDDAIRADDSTITLAEHVGSDRGDLEAAVRAKDRATAVKLYRGDFLVHFAISDARGFEEWVEFERRNLRGLFLSAVEAEVNAMLGAGNFSRAVELARRARDIEPLRQEAWRLLIAALAAAGDGVSTRAEANALAEMLRAEGMTADDATQRAVRSAMSVKEPPREAEDRESLVADLVGRERELSTLLGMSDAIDRRAPRAARVVGPAGIGKTRLLRDFERAARFRNRQVVFLSAVRATSRISWGAIARIAERLAVLPGALGINEKSAGVLVGLNPALSSTFHGDVRVPSDGGLGRELMIAVGEVVKAVAEERPLVLIIDDAQWLDAASRGLVEALPGLCESSGLLVVLGERDAGGLVHSPAPFASVSLGPLNTEDCEALVTSIATLPDDSWCRDWITALHTTSAGIPLAVLDLLRLAVENECARVQDGAWKTDNHESLVRLTDETAPRQARIRHLSSGARRFVALLAIGGGPLDIDIAARVTALSTDDVAGVVEEISRRGMAVVVGRVISLEHEEYGLAARDSTTLEERHDLLVSLAEEFAASQDPEFLRRAYVCAEGAGDEALQDKIAAKYVVSMRERFPSRTVREIVSELIGLGTRAERLQHLERLLDGSMRHRRRTVAVGAAIVAVAAATALGVAWGARHTAPDAVVEIVMYDSVGNVAVAETPVDFESWVPGRPVRINATDARKIGRAPARSLARDPRDGTRWVAVREHPAPELEDLVLFDGAGRERALAPAPGDDVSPSWSPDGRAVVFATARYSGKDWSDLAVVDVQSGQVSRIGAGPGLVGRPAFSDDGGGIVFERDSSEARGKRICVISLGGGDAKCHAISSNYLLVSKLTWPSPTVVYFGVTDTLRRRSSVLSWDPETGAERDVAVCRGTLRPQQEFRTVFVCNKDDDPLQPEIAPLMHPDAWRPIDLRGFGGVVFNLMVQDIWLPATAAKRVRIAGSRDAIVGIPHQLLALVERSDSGTAPAVGARWEIGSGAGTIDTAGIFRAPRAETALVRVRLPTGLIDSARVAVHDARTNLLLDELWDPAWLTRWRRFGRPLPVVVRARGDRAFWNAGDGSYISGVYSSHEYSTAGGLTLDVIVSTPVAATKWQQLYVGFLALDEPWLSRWDHESGYLHGQAGGQYCAFEYPSDPEGPNWGDSYMAGGSFSGDATPGMRRGEDYHVRMQIFPDGRCGMALNGRAMMLRQTTASTGPVRMIIYGSSVGTTMLVKELTVTRGVAAGVDWGRVMR